MLKQMNHRLFTPACVDSLIVYVDMDGVIADFDKKLESIVGCRLAETSKSAMWRAAEKLEKEGKPVWGDMDKMPDADELMEYVAQYNNEILSATGHIKCAGPEKHDWMSRYWPDRVVNLARRSAMKKDWAHSNAILIDDRTQSIDPWVEAGGIGILHTSTEDTIRQLKAMGL